MDENFFLRIFFDGWEPLLRTVIIGFLAYITLILLLRISGKRTLSKMNAFDLVVTVAFGSTFASIIISKDTSLAQGALAFAVLIAGQFIITWLSVRSNRFQNLVKATPTLLLYRGEVLETPRRQQRVAREELSAAVRNQGLASFDDVEAVVLETDGSFTVIPRSKAGEDASTLRDLAGYPSPNEP